MLWDVMDNGHVLVRLRSTGASAKMLDRDDVNRYIANIAGDLTATLGIDIVTHQMADIGDGQQIGVAIRPERILLSSEKPGDIENEGCGVLVRYDIHRLALIIVVDQVFADAFLERSGEMVPRCRGRELRGGRLNLAGTKCGAFHRPLLESVRVR